MKKFFSFALAVLMIASILPLSALSTVTATTVAADLSIATAQDLIAWAQSSDTYEGKTVVLTADITVPDGQSVTKNDFYGTFDGQGHTISGLTKAFISILSGSYTVRNLGFRNCTASGGYLFEGQSLGDAGSLTLENLRFESCTGYRSVIENADTGSSLDGIRVESSCSFTESGLITLASAGITIRNSYVAATVNSGTAGSVGGFIGLTDGYANAVTVFDNCWFAGKIVYSGGNYHSCFVGNNNSKQYRFTNCLNTGTLQGTDVYWAAGFTGAVYTGASSFENCMNAGKILQANGSAATAGWSYAADVRSDNALSIGSKVYSLVGSAVTDGVRSDKETAALKAQTDKIHSITAADYEAVQEALGWGRYVTGTDGSGKALWHPVPAPFANDPTVIRTAEELIAWGGSYSDGNQEKGKTVLLANDITLPADAAWVAKSVFSGTFDGQGHTIFGLKGGFIGAFGGLGVLKNLTFENCTGNGSYLIPGNAYGKMENLCVKNSTGYKSLIYNLQSSAVVDGVRVENSCVFTLSGIAEYAQGGAQIKNTYVAVQITGNNIAGFLFRLNGGGVSVSNSMFDGTLTVNTSDTWDGVGGFLYDSNGQTLTLTDCVSAGKIVTRNGGKGAHYVGGFVARAMSNATIVLERCLAATQINEAGGTLTGNGIVGEIKVAITANNVSFVEGTAANKVTRSGDAGNVTAAIAATAQITASDFDSLRAALNWGWFSRSGGAKLPVPTALANMLSVGDYVDGGVRTAPAKEGMVFAGWYVDASCNEVYTADNGYAYAKFVDERVLEVGAQIKKSAEGKASIRFLSTVDSLDYRSVQITIVRSSDGKTYGKPSTTVYEGVKAGTGYADASAISGTKQSRYAFAYVINNIPEAAFGEEFSVRACWTTLDGTVVYGNGASTSVAALKG